MSGAIAERFAALRETRRNAMIPYLMSGFPTRTRFRELVRLAVEEGADLMEIGVPFSDPLADGPVIQAAGHSALQSGTDLAGTLEDLAQLTNDCPKTPWIIMSYLNPMRRFGLPRLARHRLVYATAGDLRAAGIHALSIVALAPEEQEHP